MRVGIKKFRNNGFTLAEVLITLAIIGVIAAITIPTLLQNKQEQELKIAFKKTYSELAQATQRVIHDNGGTMVGICPTSSPDCLKDKYEAYLNIIKSCISSQANGNCWYDNDGSSKYLSGNPKTDWSDNATLMLNNGSVVRISMYDIECKSDKFSPKGDCGAFIVDVNGLKKPNIVGKDIFYIHLHKDGIAPWGNADDDTNNSSRSATCINKTTGFGCAALVLQDVDY